ncbi:PIN-like domain-containing protein [Carboxylicivirga caseinilyticus]|uniref:PIN-like domain-containing protein n=1 Tax=Carboxylicivirga caseinilyticus TaxID=3417572 RepID=UPI003D34F982|nr:hypothetical protein [Marinilabiliaceae bacterium A049]
MRNLFNGYYIPNQDDLAKAWKDECTLFIFDTNIFLNLYSYAEQTREDFFQVINNITEQIWIPYHVGLEYQRRRLDVIKNEKAIFSSVNNYISKIEKVFSSDIEQLNLKSKFPKLHESTVKFQKETQKLIVNYKKSLTYWDEKQPCVRTHDSIREKLDILFENKVGNKPDQIWIDEVEKDGEERYKNEIPPGYKDASKDQNDKPTFSYGGIKYQRKYGDLILWKQIIKKASKEDVKNVIFITDDAKADWWTIIDSRGKKRIGPHANLQAELMDEANIKLFHMYSTSSFLEDGKSILGIGVSESSINEVDSVFERNILRNIYFKNHSNIDGLDNLRWLNKSIDTQNIALNNYLLELHKTESEENKKKQLELDLFNTMKDEDKGKYLDFIKSSSIDIENKLRKIITDNEEREKRKKNILLWSKWIQELKKNDKDEDEDLTPSLTP